MDLSRKVIQVLDSGGNVIGTGFLCHPNGFALTCWHVMVKAAWPRVDAPDHDTISGKVIHAKKEYRAALLSHWSAEDSDIAVLQIEWEDPPVVQSWDYLELDTHWRVSAGDGITSFGYPQLVHRGAFKVLGVPLDGQIGGLTPIRLSGEVSATPNLSVFPIVGLNIGNIDHGYSGAPVVHARTQRVIGLVYAKQPDEEWVKSLTDKLRPLQAFIIPIDPIFRRWSELKGYHDVFEKIRHRFGKQAQVKLDEKLYDAPFIPLNLEYGIIPKKNSTRSHGEDGAEPHLQHGRTWKPVDPKQLYYLRGRYVLSASVGAGKTTLIYKLAAELVAHTDTVPIMLSCRELERINPNSWEALKLVLVDRFTTEFMEFDLADRFRPESLRVDLEDFFERAYRRIIFLFDGLDQINGPSPAELVEQVFKNITFKRSVVITSRPSAVLPLEADRNLTFLRLQSFTSQDQRKYFGGRYQQARNLTILAPELATIPMLACMIRELMIEGTLTQVSTRTEIYTKFVRFILSKHASNKLFFLESPRVARMIRPALNKLAFRALANNPPQIQTIEETFSHDTGIELEELTRFGLVNRVLEQGETCLLFTHQSYQEFLAAEYACDHPEEIERVLRERWNPKWREVIRFMAGLHGQSVIKRIQSEADNVIYSNLFLSARCLPEVKLLDGSMTQRIRGELIALLRGPFRMLALEALGQLSNLVDGATLHTMAVLLEDPNNLVRSAAIEALTRHAGRIDAETVRAICARLADKQEDVCLTARQALSRLEERVDVETLYVIANRLGDGSPRESRAAMEVLGNLAEQVDAKTLRIIASVLERDDSHVSTRAGETLARLGKRLDDETLRVIKTRLAHKEAWARTAAMSALLELESLDAGTVEAVVARLEDEDSWMRNAAGHVLAKLREGVSVETMDAIIARLGSREAAARQAALEALTWLSGRIEAQTVWTMVELLEDPDEWVRKAAIEALAALGERIEPNAVRAIAGRLTDGNAWVSHAAGKALGTLGDRVDSEILRFIVSLLEDANPTTRGAAIDALASQAERIEAEAVRGIAVCLEDEDGSIRASAFRALRGMAEQVDTETLEVIRAALVRQDGRGRWLALRVLASLDSRVDLKTFRVIVRCLRDKDLKVREAAIEALAKQGDWIETETVRAIAARVGDEDYTVSKAACEALAGLTEKVDAKTLRLIVGRLKGRDFWVRRAALDALMHLAHRLDYKIIYRIVKRLKDSDPSVREAAIEALAKQGDRIEAEIVRAIAARLSDVEDGVSATALSALTHLEKQIGNEMLRAIIARLTHKDDGVCYGAITSLLHLHEAGISLPSRT